MGWSGSVNQTKFMVINMLSVVAVCSFQLLVLSKIWRRSGRHC
jgi:hypothetical protein